MEYEDEVKKILKTAVIIADIVIIALLTVIIYFENSLPDNYFVTSGGSLRMSGIVEAMPCSGGETELSVDKAEYSSNRAELRLLGMFPIKTVSVQEVDAPVVVPCGEPFGIKLLTDGVIVVEVSSFRTEDGFKSPAEQCGIRAGDIIKTVDGKTVMSNGDIERIISSGGGNAVTVELLRGGKSIQSEICPLKCTADDTYRAGLWVRDSSAGIGTMTFYIPETGVFAGLGHPVCDIDTGEPLPLYTGETVDVSITGVKIGTAGNPGELMGAFSTGFATGSLERNGKSGLYGIMKSFSPQNQALPLGFRQDVSSGKAYIFATVSGSKPNCYEIDIEKIDLSDANDGKNMVIRVTDKRLIEKTGGIVQGMSGSPIIQNGRLIGAVTHVFVNNPTKGYAVFADKMYEQALLVKAD